MWLSGSEVEVVGIMYLKEEVAGREGQYTRFFLKSVSLCDWMKSLLHCYVTLTRSLKASCITTLPLVKGLANSSWRMKRSISESAKTPKSKKQREPEPDYCDIAPKLGEDGSIIWPAPAKAIEDARTFLRQWFG